VKQSKVSNNFVPERLREARMARGLTITELAKKIGVTRQAVSQYELGHRTPNGEIIRKIYDILEFPYAFYTNPVKTDINNNVLYRSLVNTKRQIRDMMDIRFKWLKKIYLYLENYIEFPEVNLPNIDQEDNYSEQKIENLAKELRDFWGIGLGPIKNLTRLLEKNGFIISRSAINKDIGIDACSEWHLKRPFVYLLSNKDSAVRSRFDLAHELGHIILHTETDIQSLNKSELKKVEKEAYRFASAFLLPEDSFPNEVLTTSLEHLISLKERWLVSIAAIVYRCDELKIFSKDQTLYIRKKLSRKRMRKSEPLDDIIKSENPVLLKQAIEMLIDNNIIKKYNFIDYFNYPIRELENISGLSKGYLNMNKNVINFELKKKAIKDK